MRHVAITQTVCADNTTSYSFVQLFYKYFNNLNTLKMYLCKNHLDGEEWWHFIQLNASITQYSTGNRYHFKDTGIATGIVIF